MNRKILKWKRGLLVIFTVLLITISYGEAAAEGLVYEMSFKSEDLIISIQKGFNV